MSSSPKKVDGEKKAEGGSAPAAKAGEEAKTTLELLEEDDEFEEFAGGTWDEGKVNEADDAALWKDNWDDDDGKDDFVDQLKQQIAAGGGK